MKSLETRVEKVQKLLGEVRVLVKLCALATDFCITDSDLQLKDSTELYIALRNINSLLINIEHILDN